MFLVKIGIHSKVIRCCCLALCECLSPFDLTRAEAELLMEIASVKVGGSSAVAGNCITVALFVIGV